MDFEQRQPPQAIDIENTVLGSMMIDESAMEQGMELLDARCFFSKPNAKVYNAMRQIFDAGGSADSVSIEQKLKEVGKFEEVGGQQKINELSNYGLGGANFEYHCTILREKKLRRQGIRRGIQMQKDFYNDEKDVFDTYDEHTEGMMDDIGEAYTDSMVNVGSHLSETLDYLDDIRNEEGIVGVPAGNDLDMYFGGWKPGLHIIGADTSMGKTSLLMDMAMFASMNCPEKYRTPVAIFSLEMSRTNQILRLLSKQSGVSTSKMMRGKITDSDFEQIVRTAEQIFETQLFLDTSPGVGLRELAAKVKKLKRDYGIGWFGVDYMQLLGNDERAENRQVEVANIARGLKNIALETNLPCIALSQLSRKVENKPKCRPDKKCLRESGEIEQAADTITFIYRPEYYGVEEYNEIQGKSSLADRAFLIIAKHKNGPMAEIELGYDKQTVSFYNTGHSMWPNRQHMAEPVEDAPY